MYTTTTFYNTTYSLFEYLALFKVSTYYYSAPQTPTQSRYPLPESQ
jgi:hypothetical protein